MQTTMMTSHTKYYDCEIKETKTSSISAWTTVHCSTLFLGSSTIHIKLVLLLDL